MTSPPTPRQAVALQESLRQRVIPHGAPAAVRTVAGVDISVRADHAFAAVVVLDRRTLATVEQATATRPVEFPYVPGLLAFRELPAILDAFALLRGRPDLLLVDGHGYAHPRRCGIACHLGVELDLPALGCGKTRLIGVHREPGPRRGAQVRLVDGGEVIGKVVRSRAGVKPIYVSIGHRIDLRAAVSWTLRLCTRYRLPEPIRAAHGLAGEVARSFASAPGRRSR